MTIQEQTARELEELAAKYEKEKNKKYYLWAGFVVSLIIEYILFQKPFFPQKGSFMGIPSYGVSGYFFLFVIFF